MRSGMKWLFALAMFVAVPAGCLTEAPVPQDEANAPALSVEEQPLEEALSCPGGLVDCCGDGTCTLPQVCKYIQCESEAPKSPPIEEQSTCGDWLVDCCHDGICMSPETCRFTQCSSEAPAAPPREPEALAICPDGLVDCCGDGRCFPTWVCGSSQHDCEGPPPGLRM